MPKTNIGLQQHIYLEQSILMQISNLEHSRMPTEGKLNPALFHKFVEKFVKPDIYISLVLELISNWIDLSYVSWWASGNQSRGSSYQCLLCYLEQQWFLHVRPFTFSLVGWILVNDLQRQGKCCDSCTRSVNHHTGTCSCSCYRWPTRPGPVVFLAVTKKFDIATQNLQVPLKRTS